MLFELYIFGAILVLVIALPYNIGVRKIDDIDEIAMNTTLLVLLSWISIYFIIKTYREQQKGDTNIVKKNTLF